MYVLTTSGTTGEPKTDRYNNLAWSMGQLARRLNLSEKPTQPFARTSLTFDPHTVETARRIDGPGRR